MCSDSGKSLQLGATLIEVLIAVLVLSIGLLGALKLQTEGVRLNADSKYTVLAAAFAHDALDALTLDRFNDRASWTAIDTITTPLSCNTGTSSAASSTASGGTGRASEWAQKVACDLPDGKAKVSCTSAGEPKTCNVELRWTPSGRDTVSATYSVYAGAASSAAASSAASSS